MTTIKRFFLCGALSTLCAAGATAQSTKAFILTAADRADILAKRETVWRAWFGGDTATLATIIAPALAAGGAGGWSTRATSFKSSHDFAAGGGKLASISFADNQFDTKDHVVVLTSHYTYVLDQGGKRETTHGFATELFVKENGKWVHPFWYLEQ